MVYKQLQSYILTLIFIAASVSIFAQPTTDSGKELFKANCAQCHAKNMKSDATGPALGGFEERWADFPREDLYNWIKNSQAMIANGHPRAVELWNEWKPTQMQAFPNLSDENIESITLYINAMYDGTLGGNATAALAAGGDSKKAKPNNWLYYILFGVLGLLALILTRILTNLNKLAAAKEGVPYVGKTLVESLTSKGVVTFALFTLIILGGYTTVTNATNLGRQEGYAPEQPIKFSHETHAGVNKIDCQYCHDGARRSKHSVIPAANTCMNCHSAIKVGSEYGTAELTKIYASIGYDPSTNKYIENYMDLPQDSIKAIYAKWIGDNFMKEAGKTELGKEGMKVVNNQWDDLVNSLTSDHKTTIGGPIEWVRIHNLPDHVYFNHAQHVSVGKVECETCHGEVGEMKVLEQASPLSMGWCVNCHRETEVKFTGNEYYESYKNYHSEMANGSREKVTVEDIGGLECQKCHY